MQGHPSRHKVQRKIDRLSPLLPTDTPKWALCSSHHHYSSVTARAQVSSVLEPISPVTLTTWLRGSKAVLWKHSDDILKAVGSTICSHKAKKITVIGLSRKMQAFIQMME